MEKEDKGQRSDLKASEPDFLLQWGNRKRLRCVRGKESGVSHKFSGGIRRKITSQVDRCFMAAADKENSHLQAHRFTRNSDGTTHRSTLNENPKLASPEKEDRYYSTRGSAGVDDNGKVPVDVNGNIEDRGLVWPKLYIALSSKEKEEDFLAMKGCKPPQRPKKRAKIIQRTLLLVSPGAWLTEMSQERYEVREKKNLKKRPRGLKAMGNVESDSE
ncbi:uncharacterized protein LOC115674841 isoform X1 [Syzygium oleosum]|uniref:uncharacterized protein LOC115674841 isoform X1 n=1 Tax=Syzygium oleosum TaxID=219896 RepID=UPI0011D24AA7|nr:uncharacterized protein LOC115674841 isoform X1 [Syzygium oleosum]XP_030453215.1 uncharacterized protein LOC115674841 isoform X1 [Syzygium oleosum]